MKKNLLIALCALCLPFSSFAEYVQLKAGTLSGNPSMGAFNGSFVSLSYLLFLNTADHKYYLEINSLSSAAEKYTDDRSGKSYDLIDLGIKNILSAPENGVVRLKFKMDDARGVDMPFILHKKSPISLQLDFANKTDEERMDKGKQIIVELVSVSVSGNYESSLQKIIDENGNKKQNTQHNPGNSQVNKTPSNGSTSPTVKNKQSNSTSNQEEKDSNSDVKKNTGGQSPSLQETVDYINTECNKTVGKSYSRSLGNGKKCAMYVAHTRKDGGTLIYNGVLFTYYADSKKFASYQTYIENNEWEPENPDKSYFMEYNYDNFFAPPQITEIKEFSIAMGVDTSSSEVGFIVVYFSPGSVSHHGSTKWVEVDGENSSDASDASRNFITIPYLRTDPTAFNRLKKALLHLKEASTQDDPFADH
jgi:hypothetical protein